MPTPQLDYLVGLATDKRREPFPSRPGQYLFLRSVAAAYGARGEVVPQGGQHQVLVGLQGVRAPLSAQILRDEERVAVGDLPAGTYSVTVTDAVGCTASATTVINQAPATVGQEWPASFTAST